MTYCPTDSQCNLTIPCVMELPFTGTSILRFSTCVLLKCAGLGSGITIKGLQIPGASINFTVIIDGNGPQQVSFPDIPMAEQSPTIYDLTLYDNQSLPLSNHHLTVM